MPIALLFSRCLFDYLVVLSFLPFTVNKDEYIKTAERIMIIIAPYTGGTRTPIIYWASQVFIVNGTPDRFSRFCRALGRLQPTDHATKCTATSYSMLHTAIQPSNT